MFKKETTVEVKRKYLQVLSLKERFEFVVENSFQSPYIIISIQDTQNGGYGVQFTKTNYCKDVLTVFFDDTDTPTPNLQVITNKQAEEIIKFIIKNNDIDNIIIHCMYGQSRSKGVAAAISKYFNGTDETYQRGCPYNARVYRRVLEAAHRLLG